MRFKIIAVAAVLIVGVLVAMTWNGDSGRASRIKELQRERQKLRAGATSDSEDLNTKIDRLAATGFSLPLPDRLKVAPTPEGPYWYVGRPDTDSVVEIPFKPGRLPKPPGSPLGQEPLANDAGFLGASACKECHAKNHDGFVHTAHHLTSQLGTQETIAGSLEGDASKMQTSNPLVHFQMLEARGEPQQRVHFYDWIFDVPMQIITGSGKIAQTYLFWHGDALYQNQVTYLTKEEDWVNSPGYVDGDAWYSRAVTARCLDCHATYAKQTELPNKFDTASLMLGISCERCHGPGKNHVEHHRANASDKVAFEIAMPSDLPRERELDICNQCHSGLAPLKGDAFSFRPGDSISDHYETIDPSTIKNGVHTSNQHARLSMSECFKQTEMTCIDCHNPHANERGKTALFSERCIKCHEPEKCGEFSASKRETFVNNCIDCHMPMHSGHVRLETAAGDILQPLRDHFIRSPEK